MGFYQQATQFLEEAKRRGSLRTLTAPGNCSSVGTPGGTCRINLSGNDYLALGGKPDLTREFLATRQDLFSSERSPFSASASRLLTGNHAEYARLEARLGELYENRAALALMSGYHVNVGLLGALASEGDLIVSDRLNHASLIDGIRLSKARHLIYPHLDYDRLRELLGVERARHRNLFIVTESVFSMDGDVADLNRLAAIKREHDGFLVVDEAHALGVFGPRGLGLAEEKGLIADVDIIVGTFGKALCSSGAFIACDPLIREYLVNRLRPLIYSTAQPPLNVAWTGFLLEKVLTMEAERQRVLSLAAGFREKLQSRGLRTLGESQIVPLLLGSNDAALAAARTLGENGFLVFPIRPPTVPEGTSRIRFSLNADIEKSDLARLAALI